MTGGAAESSVLRFGAFELDTRSGELRKSGALIRLQPQPLKVLALLAGRAGELVTRDELQQQIWGNDTFVDFEQGLNFCIKQIRLALGDDADSPRYIETLPRRGYRFLAPVTRANGPSAAPAMESVAPTPAAGQWAWRRWMALTVAAAILLGAAGYLLRGRFASPRPGAGRVLVVVLPFENLSRDPEQEFFSDGLTEEMITQLSSLRLQRLGVIARTSAMRYKRTEKSAAEIGRELNVDYILEGTVRREGERVRITVQLIHATDQTNLWVGSYEGSLANVFEIQKEVAQRVARSLAFEILPAQQVAGPGITTNPQAREAYLKGRYFSQKGEVRNAVENFRQAIDLDPHYAAAYAGLSTSLVFASPASEFMPRAKASALRALELDDSLAEAHSALGMVKLVYDWDFPGAEKEFQRALELDPSNAEARLRYSHYLAATGRLQEAIAEGQQAQRLDPLAPLIGQAIGRYYHFLGREDRAIECYQKTLELDPNFYWSHLFLSFSYERTGQYDLWWKHFRESLRTGNASPEVIVRMEKAYAAGGYPAAAREEIAVQEDFAKKRAVPSATLAIRYVRLDKEKAFYWLQKAYEGHTRDLIYLNVEPEYDPIRSDPRFQDIVRRVGLPPAPKAR